MSTKVLHKLPALLNSISEGVSPRDIEQDIEAGSLELLQLVGSADGSQCSSDTLTNSRHFSNTLFNIMRGGTFYDEYRFPLNDFLHFVGVWNKPLQKKYHDLLDSESKTRNPGFDAKHC